MRIDILPATTMPGLQSRVPETKEGPGPDRDHDADNKSAVSKPAATPVGLGNIIDRNA